MTVLCIPTSAADDAAVCDNGIKILLANGWITSLLMLIQFLLMDLEIYKEMHLIESS